MSLQTIGLRDKIIKKSCPVKIYPNYFQLFFNILKHKCILCRSNCSNGPGGDVALRGGEFHSYLDHGAGIGKITVGVMLFFNLG